MEQKYDNVISMKPWQKEALTHIYKLRIRIFSAFVPAFFVLCLVSFARLGNAAKFLKEDNIYLNKQTVLILYLVLCLSFTLLISIIIYRKKILPYKKDIALEKVAIIDYEIIMKSQYPHVSQYYFKFIHMEEPFYEVTQGEYERYELGDVYSIYVGIHSNYRFNELGKYEVI